MTRADKIKAKRDAALALVKRGAISGAEILRSLGLPPNCGATYIMRPLVEEGVVKMRRDGKAVIYYMPDGKDPRRIPTLPPMPFEVPA